MNKTKKIKKIGQENVKSQETNESIEKKEKILTPRVIIWIISFLIMLFSLIYKEAYLSNDSEEWKSFSAVHVITALICIISITIYNLKNQNIFDSDIDKINTYIQHVPIITNNNRIYANDG